MAGWETKSIGEIAQVKGGKRVPKGYKLETSPTAHPYITVTDFSDDGSIDTTKLRFISDEIYEQIKRYTISHKDLYISIAGTIGKTGYVPEELDGANLTENACKLVLNLGIDKDFVYYFTKTTDFIDQAGINTRVAAQPKLALERLKTISLRVPPLPEQKRIVAIVDEAFAGIDAAVANTEKNLANARELFESYLNAVFTQKGDGWVEKTLGEVCDKIQDGAHHSPKKFYTEKDTGRFLYITSKNIRNNYMDLTKIQYVDSDFHETIYPRCQPELGDVLLTKDGANTGNVTLNTIDEPFSLLSSVCLIKPNLNFLNPSFLKYYIQSRPGFEQITGKMTGAAIKRIVLKTIKAATMPMPEVGEQVRLVDSLDALLEESQRLETIYQQKLDNLAELKQSILQKAFAGELTALPEKALDEAIA